LNLRLRVMSLLGPVYAFRRIPPKPKLQARLAPAVAFRRNTATSLRKPLLAEGLQSIDQPTRARVPPAVKWEPDYL
jgi:hypothetical protein